ncbi:hypothetical protein V8B97DRAFT_1868897, partial [Scleroderma yunnanense]
DAGWAVTFVDLADLLNDWFLEKGKIADSSKAIALQRSTLYIRPSDHVDRHTSLYCLASCLYRGHGDQST